MSSRVLLSICAFLFGGMVVLGLISIGTLEPVSLGRASLLEEIAFLAIAGLPVIGWFAVFYRTPG